MTPSGLCDRVVDVLNDCYTTTTTTVTGDECQAAFEGCTDAELELYANFLDCIESSCDMYACSVEVVGMACLFDTTTTTN